MNKMKRLVERLWARFGWKTDEIKTLEARLSASQSDYQNVFRMLHDATEERRLKGLTGILCVEGVLKRGIDYYDPGGLPYAEGVTYREKGQEVLRNATFINEVRHLEADWITHIAKYAKDFSEVRDLRMCINALEVLQERLGSIPDPRKPPDPDDLDLHSAV